MKTLLLLLLLGCASTRVWAQTPAANGEAQMSPTGTAAAMQHGRMMRPQDGRMVPMTAEMPLPNGARVSPRGKLMMPNGEWMPLREGDQVRMNGMVVPALPPAHRRVTRFNKHVMPGVAALAN